MAVVVVQRDKDTNFIKMLRTYMSYVGMEEINIQAKKRAYFVSRSIKKKLKRLEAARKVRSASRMNNKRKINTNKKNTTAKQPSVAIPAPVVAY